MLAGFLSDLGCMDFWKGSIMFVIDNHDYVIYIRTFWFKMFLQPSLNVSLFFLFMNLGQPEI